MKHEVPEEVLFALDDLLGYLPEDFAETFGSEVGTLDQWLRKVQKDNFEAKSRASLIEEVKTALRDCFVPIKGDDGKEA